MYTEIFQTAPVFTMYVKMSVAESSAISFETTQCALLVNKTKEGIGVINLIKL